MNNIDKLFSTVIDNDYCIGCGACASLYKDSLRMEINIDGKYVPIINSSVTENIDINVLKVCPFSSESSNEDVISKQLFGEIDNINYDKNLGYFLSNYAGYVSKGNFRRDGSSGGMGTWISHKLLDLRLVDYVIHVKNTSQSNDKVLFEYSVSSSFTELKLGSKSKYYPIEMSGIIEFVKENPGNYSIIGIPCFIKAVRLLANEDSIIKERIKYTIGLVCGHLKSDMFAKTIGWELGIHPDRINFIDFRVKGDTKYSSDYNVQVKGITSTRARIEKSTISSSLLSTNWGHGFFKYNACDYCDDVIGETADVSIGDAWLPEYNKDNRGTNIVVTRNIQIQELIDKYRHELNLDEISSSKIYESQIGGFRHKREALSYRLYLNNKNSLWTPLKRVKLSNKISKRRKKIYRNRIELSEASFIAYKNAYKFNDFLVFKERMNPLILKYKKLYSKTIFHRIIRKTITISKKIIRNV